MPAQQLGTVASVCLPVHGAAKRPAGVEAPYGGGKLEGEGGDAVADEGSSKVLAEGKVRPTVPLRPELRTRRRRV